MNATSTHPIPVTSENFQAEVFDSPVPVVVDFWAPWCGPCRTIAPVLDGLAARFAGRVKVAKINVDEEQALAGRFKIRGIPTLVVVTGGEVAGQIVGFPGTEALDELFDDLSGIPLKDAAS